MFYEKENAFNTFIRPQEYTQCIIVRNITLFTRKLHRPLLSTVSSEITEVHQYKITVYSFYEGLFFCVLPGVLSLSCFHQETVTLHSCETI